MEKFQMKENDCYSTVTRGHKIVTEEKSNNKCIILLFVFVLALFLSTAGACVAFILELSNLQNEIQQLNANQQLSLQLNDNVSQFLNTSIEMLYQQQNNSAYQQLNEHLNTAIDTVYQKLNEQNTSIDTAYQQLNEQLNTAIDTVYQKLNEQNTSIDTAYQQLNEQLNTAIDMVYQKLNQQNTSIDTAYQQLNEQLNTAIDMVYQKLNQQNTSIDTAYQQLNEQLNTSIEMHAHMLFQQFNQQNTSIDSAYQQLNAVSQQLITSSVMLNQTLNQQNDFIRAHNSSIDMLHKTVSQQNDIITRELNSSINMFYQQLNLQNESIQFAFQQLNTNLTRELNSGIDQLKEVNSSISQLDEVVTNRLDSILDRLEFPELYTPQPQCGDGFWKQVAYIDLSNSSHQCPSVWQEYPQSATPPRYCALPQGNPAGCEQTSFPVNTRYDKVCGRVTGRSIHSTDSFDGRGHRTNENYVDGVSITYSSDRSHIWSFAAGHRSFYHCPCGSTNPRNPPSFVGDNYFCDDAVNGAVWDGEGCTMGEEECCLFNSPPWFAVQLPEVAMDDIDVRICIDEFVGNENVGIELLELYVQIF